MAGLAMLAVVGCGGGKAAAPIAKTPTTAATTTTLSVYEQMRTWSQTWRQTTLSLKAALTGVDFEASLMGLVPSIPAGLRGKLLDAQSQIQFFRTSKAVPAPDFVFSGNLDSALSSLAFDANLALAAVDGAAAPAAILATNRMKTDEDKLNATLSTVGL